MFVKFETTVKGGFPVIVEADYFFATDDKMTGNPMDGMAAWDQGEPDRFENVGLLTLKGKPATFIESKMTDKDWQEMEIEIAEQAKKQALESDYE